MSSSTPAASTASNGGALAGAAWVFGLFGRLAGLIAGLITLVLAISVLLGITLRGIGIDNSWTYDLDQFSLVWLAFLGAAYTGYRGGHVTSGIALENLLGSGAVVLVVLRFILVAGFLAVFTYSGYTQFHSSWMFHEQTLDTVQWSVWIAKLALPVGGAAWLAAECHKLFAHFAGTTPIDSGH